MITEEKQLHTVGTTKGKMKEFNMKRKKGVSQNRDHNQGTHHEY